MTARQLIFDLLARDKTGPATRGAAKNLEDVGDAAGDAAKSTEKLGKEADKADDKVERYGKSSRTAAEHVEHLDREIKLCERELEKLAIAFAEAETAADRADLSKGMRQTNAELNKLKKNKNVLRDLIPGEPEVKKFNTNLFEGFSDGLASLKGPAVAALLPLLGGVASAAIIGGAGVGGVIGGVLLASKDPRVKAAGSALGKNLMGQLEKDADVFVEPLLKNIGKIEVAFGGMNGRIRNIFSGSSGFLDPLVNGTLEGVKGILKGFDDLVTKGKPVMDQLGKTFAQVGQATGHALSTIAGGSKSASVALADLSDNISDLIVGSGYAVRGLTELYAGLTAPSRKANDQLFQLVVGIDKVTAETSVATTVAGTFASVQETLAKTTLSEAEAAGKAGQQMQTYADAMDDAASKGRSLYDSQTDVAQAFADAEKAAEKNGKTLDVNTQKGRDNRKALSGVAEKLVATYDAYVKVNGEGAGAQKVAEQNRAAFVRLAGQFTRTKGEAEALATELGLIPANKRTNFYANTHDAEARIAALKGSIGGVHGKTITVHVSVTGTERLDNLGHRIGGYRAAGGPVTAGKAYIVGEKRPEVFVPNQNGTIIPSISQAGGGGGGMGAGGGSPTLTIGIARNADSVMATALLKLLRVNPSFRADVKQLLA